MKKINDPLSVKRVKGLKINKSAIASILLLVMSPMMVLGYKIYDEYHKKDVYNKLDISFATVEAIEYGTANYDPMDLVEDVPYGTIIDYTESVDTSVVGKQEVTFEVEKDDIVKEITVEVLVVDTEKPNITIDKEEISIYQGSSYDTNENITSVVDQVDGELQYLSSDDDKSAYYTITTDLNTEVVGDYSVNVKAVDLSGNMTEKSYKVSVVEEPKPVYTYSSYAINNNVSSSVDTSSVVSAAYSFLGYRYTYGGASPATGFDCSGFVYYLYGLFGKTVGRSTSDLVYSGTGISRDAMQPGDIIVWSDAGGYPTHAALYVGGDSMIHAANSNDGVILSSVSSWERYAGTIVSIRRV